jgi:hypothetical protein
MALSKFEPASLDLELQFDWDVIEKFLTSMTLLTEDGHMIAKKGRKTPDQPVMYSRPNFFISNPQSKQVQHKMHTWYQMIRQRQPIPARHYVISVCDRPDCISHFVVVPRKTSPISQMNEAEYKLLIDRFQSHCGPKNNETGCVQWINGYIRPEGYGVFHMNCRNIPAHMAAYYIHHKQDLPPFDPETKMVMRHLCAGNRLCVNWEHVMPGTHQENADDNVAQGKRVFGEDVKNHKLSAKQVEEIREKRKNGVTQKKCGEEYGVSTSTIAQIDQGNTWVHKLSEEQKTTIEKSRKRVKRLSPEAIRTIQLSKGTLTKKERMKKFAITAKTLRKYDRLPLITEEIVAADKAKRWNTFCKRVISNLQKNSKLITAKDGSQHLVWKGNESQDPCALTKTTYFGKHAKSGKPRNCPVHMASYLAHNGMTHVPPGLQVCHGCLYKYCVSIECLSLGTPKKNSADKERDGTSRKEEDHPNHQLTKEEVKRIRSSKGLATARERAKKFKKKVTTIQMLDHNKVNWPSPEAQAEEPSQELKELFSDSVKLTPELRERIRSSKGLGPQDERARRLNVIIGTVQYVDNETRKHPDVALCPTEELRALFADYVRPKSTTQLKHEELAKKVKSTKDLAAQHERAYIFELNQRTVCRFDNDAKIPYEAPSPELRLWFKEQLSEIPKMTRRNMQQFAQERKRAKLMETTELAKVAAEDVENEKETDDEEPEMNESDEN